MQVSTPAHVPVTSDAVPLGDQESIQSKTVQTKTLKYDKLGVFAKILEGLICNPKGEAAGKGLLMGIPKETGSQVSSEVKRTVPNTDPKGKKKLSGTAAAEKTKEPGPLGNRSFKGDKVSGEVLALAVPQNIDKPAVKAAEKEDSAADRITRKTKKDALSLQNPEAETKTAESLGSAQEKLLKEGAVKAEIQAGERLAKSKTEEQEVKARKSAEKERSRKADSPLSQPGRREAETAQASRNSPQVSGNAGKDRGSKLAESKAKDKRREHLNMEVRDLRSWETVQQDSVQETQLKVEGKSGAEGKTAELTADLSSGSKSRDPAVREADYRPAQAFEDILARELYQNLNGDIVRQAQVILREHGEGTIRLALKPEFLGNVKIQLEMTENKITGHIIVESNEALRAFEREINSLEQAFKDSGFAGVSLDMSLASGNGRNGADQQWRGTEGNTFFSERFAASVYDAVSDRTEEPVQITGGRSSSGLPQVNMLA